MHPHNTSFLLLPLEPCYAASHSIETYCHIASHDCTNVTFVCSFIDFDISPPDVPCNETYVMIGPEPCVVWCGDHFPRVYTSARRYVTVTYIYRESGPALRRGFILKYITGLLLFSDILVIFHALAFFGLWHPKGYYK